MKIFTKITAILLSASVLFTVIPMTALAADEGQEYSIENAYIKYTINSATGGYAITTLEGNPKKNYDNNIPLLYKEDKTRSSGTSFTTIRINDKDYIFGAEYGLFGLSTTLHEPVISEEGRLITTQWDISDYSIIQKVAISTDANSDTTGNCGISYEVKNNSSAAANIGVRILLDTSLGNTIDAPYVVTDTNTVPQYTEKEYKDSEMPSQIRCVDSVTQPKKVAYAMTKGWNNGVEANRLIVGHWANLANTRYDYTPDKYCDFTNYSNKYRVPDSALAFYWDASSVGSGSSKNCEMLYGIGNFSQDAGDIDSSLDMTCDKVSLSADKKSYDNGGTINVKVNLDNSTSTAKPLKAAMITVTADDGLTVNGTTYASYSEINVGDIKTNEFTVTASTQKSITSKAIYVSVTATADDNGTDKTVNGSTKRYVLLPAVTADLPKVQMTAVKPEIVYTTGEKNVTVSGDVSSFKTLEGIDGWDMYLVPEKAGKEVKINKSDIAFGDATYKSFSFKTSEDLVVGKYKIVFRFTDSQLIAGFNTSEITAAAELEVSSDTKYKIVTYGIVALVRYEHHKYTFVTLANEADYLKFYNGEMAANGITHDFRTKSTYDYEILIIVRGKIVQMDNNGKTYYQASPQDGPITINGMLNYGKQTGDDKPLTISDENGEYSISGNGKLNVINSITVWKDKFSFSAKEGLATTLDTERYGGAAKTDGTVQMQLSLDGAAMIIQSIGGFLIDMKYGVMSSNLEDDTDKTTTYGIGFGGSISIPINAKKKAETPEEAPAATSDQEDFSSDLTSMFGEDNANNGGTTSGTTDTKKTHVMVDKKTVFSEGQLSADVDDVRFGQKATQEDGKITDISNGFIGLDTTVTVAVPKDVLGDLVSTPAAFLSVRIDTLDNIYTIKGGVALKVIQCEGVISLKQVKVKGKDKVLPDSLQFYIRDGLMIPIAPPELYMTGLGGGIDKLADTIGDSSVGKLPPVTILLFTRLALFEVMTGDFNASINLSGLSLKGNMKFKPKGTDATKITSKALTIDAGISMRWLTPWYLSLYGNVNLIDGLIKGGLTITIADKYFYGYLYASLCIPDDIPIVGGKELAGIEVAVTNKFLGGNVKIIGFKFGFIVYWASGEHKFGSGIDLSPGSTLLEDSATDENGNTIKYAELYGTNIHPLTSSKAKRQSATLMQAGSTVTNTFDPTSSDNILFEVPYTGNVQPDPTAITITNPDGNVITMTPDDGSGNGNFLVQDRGTAGKFMYISVTDKSLLKKGNWTLTVNTDDIDVKSYNVDSVDDLPELSGMTYTYDAASAPNTVNVNYTTDSEKDETASIDVYLTKDKDALEKVKTSSTSSTETLGTPVLHQDIDKIQSGSQTVTIPDTFDSGTYYVVTSMTSKTCGISIKESDTPFTFTNPKLPSPVKGISVNYGTNGSLYIIPTDADNIDYTNYLVEVVPEDGSQLDNAYDEFSVGDKIFIGGKANLQAGKKYYVKIKTLRVDGDNYYYGTDTVDSELYTMPVIQKPNLTSVETNVTGEYLNTGDFTVTYKFDKPVWMALHVNGEAKILDGVMRDTWTFNEDLADGDYLIDFLAYSDTKDTATGADFPGIANSQIGFTVDTVPPVLSLSRETLESLEKTTSGYTSGEFGTNVIKAGSDGSFTVNGLTEGGATVTVNGASDGLTINPDGTFAYSGTIGANERSRELDFVATDKAGNTSTLMAYILNADFASIDSIELTKDAAKIDRDSENIETINAKLGDSFKLGVNAVNGTKSAELDNKDVEWYIMYDKGLVAFDEGRVTAVSAGTTAVRAKYITASLADGTETGPEDYVVINIAQNNKDDLKAAIDAAKAALAAAPNADQNAQDALQAVIDSAQTVYDNTDASTDEISQEAVYVKAAIDTFNKSDLKKALDAANADLTASASAEQTAKDTFMAAIASGQSVYDNPTATTSEIAAAAASVRAAQDTFDKRDLKKALDAANIILKAATGADQTVKDTFAAAIAAAQAVYDNTSATAEEIAAATASLKTATDVFNKRDLKAALDAANADIAAATDADQTLKDTFQAAITAAQAVYVTECHTTGLHSPAVASVKAAKNVFDKRDLKTALEAANADIAAATGADQTSKDTFQAAITAAQAVYDNAGATVEAIANATANLKAAKDTFDKRDLKAALDKANAALTAATSADQTTKDTLQAAITAAQEVYDNTGAAAAEIAKATADLKTATDAFNKADLKAALAAANADMAAATDADQTTKDTFRAAITAAQTVYDNTNATAAEIAAAVASVKAAQEIFDKRALKAALAAANADITAATDADQTVKNTFQAAITAAQAVYDNTSATAEEIAAAVASVKAAQDVFDKRDLKAALDKANTVLAAATSADQTTKDTLQAAITAAQAVYDNTSAAAAEIAKATADLKAATDAFNKADLKAALAAANADMAAATDADQTTKDTFRAAITAAQAVYDNTNATAAEIAAAVASVKAAQEIFDKRALKAALAAANTDIAAATDADQTTKDTFQAAITAAQAVYDNTNATAAEIAAAVASVKAAQDVFDKRDLKAALDKANADITATTNISQSYKDTFQAAIDAAQKVYDNTSATAAEVAQAATDLNAAKDVFDASKRSSGGGTTTVSGGSSSTTKYYTITAEASDNGKTELSAAKVKSGSPVTITVTPNTGYVISDILVNDKSYGSTSPLTIDSVTQNIVVKTVFKAAETGSGTGSGSEGEKETPELPFTDVHDNDWFFNDVANAYNNKLFNGVSATTFEPNSPMTRAMLVAVIGRMEGVTNYSKATTFTDVEKGSWYEQYVAWAKDNNIIKGMSDTEFAPNVSITREQMAQILRNYAIYKGTDANVAEDVLASYSDKKDVSDYAVEAMKWTVKNGIIKGRTETTLVPTGTATRAEVAAIFNRFSTLIAK